MKDVPEFCPYPDCEHEVPAHGALEFNGQKVCYNHFILLNFLSSIL